MTFYFRTMIQLGYLVGCLGLLNAPMTLWGSVGPDWAGDAHTTRQVFRFTTPAIATGAETVANPYGIPFAVVTVSEPLGAGWQDPASPFAISGVSEDGAWDLGPGGSIALTIPYVSPEVLAVGGERLDIYARVVAYQNPLALPEVEVPGSVLEDVTETIALLQPDILGQHMEIQWTARATDMAATTVTLLIGAKSQGGLVDSVEIHTRFHPVSVPSASFGAWAAAFYPEPFDPAARAFEADPDGIGIPNGLTYYLGLNRGYFGPALRSEGTEANRLLFSHRRQSVETPDVVGSYQWSTDLARWHEGGEEGDGLTVDFGFPEAGIHPIQEGWLLVAAIAEPELPPRLHVRLRVVKTENLP
jgi:hypothetical protein